MLYIELRSEKCCATLCAWLRRGMNWVQASKPLATVLSPLHPLLHRHAPVARERHAQLRRNLGWG